MSKYDYDVIVIGGGAAGLTASGIAANFGAKTLLVEHNRLGGDCTWTGCVPSKILLKAGKVAQQIRKAGKYGLIDQKPKIDFQKLIKHLHQRRQQIYEEADRPEIYEDMDIDVAFGNARFINDHEIELEQEKQGIRSISAKYFFICAGSSPAVPPVEGIDTAPYLTSESLFEIKNLPDELIIIGAGPVGIEMGQALGRLGSKVTVVDMADGIMVRDDAELANMLRTYLENEGIQFVLNAHVKEVQMQDSGLAVDVLVDDTHQKELSGDKLLLATGRRANVDGLGLDEAGISYSSKGIEVNEKCQTNQSHIYACGDITGRYQLTHMSEHMAKVAVTGALIKYPMKMDSDHIPWVTYTDPELGHIGATQKQLLDNNINFETYRFPFSKIDRALTDSEEEGLIKIYAKKWNGKIYGVDILGARAGELISEYALAMRNGLTLRNIADTIHPYPSYGLGARRAADQWYIKNQSEWQVKLIKKVFGYRGEVPDFSDSDRIL